MTEFMAQETIAEMQRHKSELQRRVCELLDDFTRSTGLVVTDLGMRTIDISVASGDGPRVAYSVAVRVEL
jgi:hypothetical protein